jgi:hypothetical protein
VVDLAVEVVLKHLQVMKPMVAVEVDIQVEGVDAMLTALAAAAEVAEIY